jgi:hypothetical protein
MTKPSRVEVGQIWGKDSEQYTVDGVGPGDRVSFKTSLWGITQMLLHGRDWSCIGIETRNGRVMLGEVRIPPPGLGVLPSVLVHRVRAYEEVTLVGRTLAGLTTELPYPASTVAGWPLVRDEHVVPEPEAAKPTDSRTSRERLRAEVDAVLSEDARQHPAYAVTRRAAILALFEAPGQDNQDTAAISFKAALACLHGYEAVRGHMTRPSDKAARQAKLLGGGQYPLVFREYERVRAWA